jgi:cell division septum initiation protein DivIVA
MNKLSQQSDKFRLLLDEVGTEVEGLKKEIRNLKKDNAQLRAKLEEEHEKQTDIFSAITESERLALRQHVQGLISKIDHHLGAES